MISSGTYARHNVIERITIGNIYFQYQRTKHNPCNNIFTNKHYNVVLCFAYYLKVIVFKSNNMP